MIYRVSWDPVHNYVGRILAGRTNRIIAGTPEWLALADDDPQKVAALLVAGERWVLQTELDQIDQHRHAAKAAALDISAARDWAAVAKTIRDRDQFYREHPHLKRKVS